MRRSLALITLALFFTGCATQLSQTRQQPPMMQAPDGTSVALISVTSAPEATAKAPEDAAATDTVKSALERAFENSPYAVVDKTSTAFEMSFNRVADSSEEPAPWETDGPTNLPPSIDSPLVMSAHVVEWSKTTETMDGKETPVVKTDVVYTLWTRNGNEIETRRVALTVRPGDTFAKLPTLVPPRGAWMDEAWKNATPGSRLMKAPKDPAQLFEAAAAVSTQAFAFPYGSHEMNYTVELATGDSSLNDGVEMMKAGDWKKAYDSFEKALEANPKLAGAHYNMGVIREIQGRTEDAVNHFEKAVELGDEEMYEERLKAAKMRLEAHQTLELPDEDASEFIPRPDAE
jgi:tetratricopeptide (TPR) repeat protein